VQLQTLADAELETLGDVVAATALLLDRVRSAGTQPERDALAADFNEAVRVLHEELAHHPTRDGQDADALIAAALVRVARLLEPKPAGG
jgi:hypothetical protein